MANGPNQSRFAGLLGGAATPGGIPQQEDPEVGPGVPSRGLLAGFTDPRNLALIAGGLTLRETGSFRDALQAASLGIQVGSALTPQQEPLTPSEISQLSKSFTPESISVFEKTRNTDDLDPIDEPATTKVTQGSFLDPTTGELVSGPVAQKQGQLFRQDPQGEFSIQLNPADKPSIDDSRVVSATEKAAKKSADERERSSIIESLRSEAQIQGIEISEQRFKALAAQSKLFKVGTSAQGVNVIKTLVFNEKQRQDPFTIHKIDQIAGIDSTDPNAATKRQKWDDRANKVGSAVANSQFSLTDLALKKVDDALIANLGVDDVGFLQPGDIPGMGAGQLKPSAGLSAEAQALRVAVAGLRNIVLRDRSGAAVTTQEAQRLIEELATGVFNSDRDFMVAYDRLKTIVREHNRGLLGQFNPKAVKIYQSREDAIKPSERLNFDIKDFPVFGTRPPRGERIFPGREPTAGGAVSPRGVPLEPGAIPGRDAAPAGRVNVLDPDFDFTTLSLTTPGVNAILQKARRRGPLSNAEKNVLRQLQTQTRRR